MTYNLDLKNKKAILVDCDGTLLDSMPSHNKSYELAFTLNNVPFDMKEQEKWSPYGGKVLMKETVIDKGYSHLVDDIIKDKQSLFSICLRKFMKPNTQLINFIKTKNPEIKVFVVSNGRKKSITSIIEILEITDFVDGIITQEDVKQTKPNPEIYLKVLENNNLKPEDVIVFEDNEIGYNAANGAGIKDIIMVDTTKF